MAGRRGGKREGGGKPIRMNHGAFPHRPRCFTLLQHNPWRGAEAFHLLMLCQKQVYENKFDRALRTALRLTDYEDLLEPKTVYCLLALTSFHCKFFAQCSRAFVKLRKNEQFSKLAWTIFRSNAPRDPPSRQSPPCPSCSKPVPESAIECGSCKTKLPFCVTSGRTLFTRDEGEFSECKVCRRKSYLEEGRSRVSCALCHARLPQKAGAGGGYQQQHQW